MNSSIQPLDIRMLVQLEKEQAITKLQESEDEFKKVLHCPSKKSLCCDVTEQEEPNVKPQMKTLDFETLMEFEPLADISVATPLNNFDQELDQPQTQPTDLFSSNCSSDSFDKKTVLANPKFSQKNKRPGIGISDVTCKGHSRTTKSIKPVVLHTPALLAAQRAAKLQQQQQQQQQKQQQKQHSSPPSNKSDDKSKTSGSNLQSISLRKLGDGLKDAAAGKAGVCAETGRLDHPNEHYEEWLRKKEQKRILEKQLERQKQQMLQQQKESSEQQLNDLRRESFAKWLRTKDEERARERERQKEMREKERLLEQERKLKVEQEAERRLRQWEEKKLLEQKRQKAQRALELARLEEERAVKQRLGEVAFQKWLDDADLRPKIHQNNQHLVGNSGNNLLLQHRADGCRCEPGACSITVREISRDRNRGSVSGSGDDQPGGLRGGRQFAEGIGGGLGQLLQQQRREQQASIESFAAAQQQTASAAAIQQSS
ncbi:putative uncharacterized protein DDB_G0271982 [Ctenocephalides felis]|uniref:putative uncharacterized protein DDB_G0271982 n=1 Tax=Ctenocephalides felis TaxID=7515 RepID=UPI000E6E46A7|nr:putative uncharacterized protein DDB_G0271982 [Ctenocephalides felis]